MRRIVVTAGLVVIASLTAAPSANAKGAIQGIRACGPSACADVRAERRPMQRFGMDLLAQTGRAVPQPPLAGYVRLSFLPRYEVPDSETFFVLGANAICTERGCTRVRTGLLPALSAAAARVEPFAPKIASVIVNGRARADRSGFGPLFDLPPAPLPSTAVWQSRHYSVIVKFGDVTPWSMGSASWIVYYPRYHALTRDGRWFHAGADVDRLIRGTAAHAEAGDGHGWQAAAAAAVALAAAAAGVGRRLRRPRSG
jgi:hypothetical protein